jgi:hypothetical protein
VEVLPKAEHPPGAVGVEAHAQVAGRQLAVVALELVAGVAVQDVDREVLAPLAPHDGGRVPLHHEDDLLQVLRDRAQPRVVVVGVLPRRASAA